MNNLPAGKNLTQQNYPNPRNGMIRYLLIFTVSLSIVLFVLASYGAILDLTSDLSYYIFPSKKAFEYEKLTAELIFLYGSGRIEYYSEGQTADQSRGIIGVSQADYGGNNTNADSIISGNYIYIPGIGVNAPIVAGTTVDDETVLRQLKQGALVYPGSSLPGSGGTTVIIGHSSSSIPWQKYGRIFSTLPRLSEGDLVIVNYNGRKYSYRITRKLTGSVDQLASLNIRDDLVLGTCWPIGTDEQRILITASLISSI